MALVQLAFQPLEDRPVGISVAVDHAGERAQCFAHFRCFGPHAGSVYLVHRQRQQKAKHSTESCGRFSPRSGARVGDRRSSHSSTSHSPLSWPAAASPVLSPTPPNGSSGRSNGARPAVRCAERFPHLQQHWFERDDDAGAGSSGPRRRGERRMGGGRAERRRVDLHNALARQGRDRLRAVPASPAGNARSTHGAGPSPAYRLSSLPYASRCQPKLYR